MATHTDFTVLIASRADLGYDLTILDGTRTHIHAHEPSKYEAFIG
jgi:hypothetical protein